MLKTSFLEMLRSFEKEELKRFEAFLKSPYFNSRSYVINLFMLIKKYAPAFDDIKLDKEELWKHLFPEKKYNYGIMKNIIYDLTKFAERFFEIEKFNSDEKARMNYLLEMLNEKHLDSIFMNKYNSFEKTFFTSSKHYETFYEELLSINQKRIELSAYHPKLRLKFHSIEIARLMILEFMVKFSTNFNSVYIEETEFNEISENDFVKLFSKAIINNTEIEKYAESVKSGSVKDYRIFLIHLKLIRAYLNPDDLNLFFDFKKTLIDNDKYIAEAGKRVLYACLSSALDNCNNTSKINKIKEIYQIMKILVDKKIFAEENGKVNPALFMLAIKTSAHVKDNPFIEKILKEFLPNIDPGLQPNLKLFGMAYSKYSKNEFDES
ncbi:MAG: hypothetical protein ABI840_10165, partial [bacterium]